MAITKKTDRRKGIRRQDSRRKGDPEKTKIEEERDKKREEVTVRHETAPEKRADSVWNWHEEFTAEWSETFLTKKRKKGPGRR